MLYAMTIAKIRRALNDSSIGRRINGSTLGVYVEAISREISDGFKEMRYDSLPKTSFEAFMFQGACPVLEAIVEDSEREASPERAYSWTTPFYRRTRTEERSYRMERVRTDDVLKSLGLA